MHREYVKPLKTNKLRMSNENNKTEILRMNLAHSYWAVTDFGDFSAEANEIVKASKWNGENVSEMVSNSAYFLANKLKKK